MTLLNFSHCHEAVRLLFLRQRYNEQSAGIVGKEAATWECWVLNTSVQLLWWENEHTLPCPTSEQPPFTRQASVSQALARLTELLYWIINRLIRETHFKSLLHWFISRLWCSQHYCAPFFPKALHLRGAFLYCWIPFPCPGHCSLEWAGQGGGCSQAAAAQGKQPHNYILYKPFIWNANYT